MKHTAKLFILLAAVLIFAACNKDKEELRQERDIVYTVAPAGTGHDMSTDNADATTSVHLYTEAEWRALLDRFCDWAEEGSTVTFHNANHATKRVATKEAVTYSTTDREAMKRWMAQMEDEGMTVTVTYDPATGTWNGTAYATAPQPPSPASGLLTYECDMMPSLSYILSFDTVSHRVYVTTHYSPLEDVPWSISGGVYEYVPCDEVNTPFAYWFINSMGENVGLFYLEFGNSFEFGGADTLTFGRVNPLSTYTLVRTDLWQTYLCSDMGLDIVMHVTRASTEIYPQQYIGQMNSNVFPYVDCIWPFGPGRFVMELAGLTTPVYSLTLNYTPFRDDDNYVLEGYTLQGEPIENDQFTIIPGISSCSAQYSFQRL